MSEVEKGGGVKGHPEQLKENNFSYNVRSTLSLKKNKNERKIYLVLQHNIKCLVYISITNLDTWVLDFLLLGSYEVYKNKNNFFLKKYLSLFCIKESLGPNFEKMQLS